MRQGRTKESERPTLAPEGDGANPATGPLGSVTWGPHGRTHAPPHIDQSDSMPGAVRAGDVLDGRFRLIRRIGTGGMSEVWEAIHVRLGRPVAVKVVNMGSHVDTGSRLLREAKTLARVQHENVVEIVDFGRTPLGAPFLVMELLRGESLQALIDREGPLEWRRAKQLGLQIVAGLMAAHGAGVLHRDVKPGNVFVLQTVQGERIKLIDFGISRAHTLSPEVTGMTKLGELLGTPAYMAPEQMHGHVADVRCDIYAMGCLLYTLLAGTNPFQAPTTAEIIYKQLFEEPPPLRTAARNADIPTSLESVVRRTLRKNPELRYPSMHELFMGLDAATATSATTLVPDEELPVPSPEIAARYQTQVSLDEVAQRVRVRMTKNPSASAPKRKKRSAAAPIAAGTFVVLAALLAAVWHLGETHSDEAETPSTAPAAVGPAQPRVEPPVPPTPGQDSPPPPQTPSPYADVETPASTPPAIAVDEDAGEQPPSRPSRPAVAAPPNSPRRPPRATTPQARPDAETEPEPEQARKPPPTPDPAGEPEPPSVDEPDPAPKAPADAAASSSSKDTGGDRIKDPWNQPKDPWGDPAQE